MFLLTPSLNVVLAGSSTFHAHQERVNPGIGSDRQTRRVVLILARLLGNVWRAWFVPVACIRDCSANQWRCITTTKGNMRLF